MLARNFVTTTASTIVGMALSFVASVMLARMLGAEQRGIYALAILIPQTVCVLATLGFPTAHIVYAGKYPDKRGAIAFQSLTFSGIVCLLTLCFYVYALTSQPVWFQRFQVIGTVNMLLACFLVFPQMAVSNLRSGILGANRISTANLAAVLTSLNQVLLIIVFLGLLKLGVTGGIIARLSCFGIILVFMSVATATQVPVRTWRPDFGFFKKSVSLGVKIYLNHISWWMLHILDRYMIAYMMPNSNRALGHYAMAAQFASMLYILPQSLRTVFLPHLSVTQADKTILAVKTTRVLFLALSPIFIVLAAGAPLIKVILGQDYAGSVLPFMLFIPGMYLAGSVAPLASYFTHIEKPMYNTAITWSGAAVNIGLNLYFIPRIGIAGAALASSISSVLMTLGTLGCFVYETKSALSQFALRRSDVNTIIGIMGKCIRKVQTLAK